jgi:polyisoprenyl-teichoic acid--peptidoglycan teichoic acid transferase
VTATTLHPAHPPRPNPIERKSQRIKLRRGLTFLAMTLLLPGSAQMAAGNKRIGRIALRAWAVLLGALILTTVLALVWRGGFITLLSSEIPLRILQAVLVVVGVCWALLMIDAWRISRPPELARRHRLGFAMLSAGLVFAVTGALFASASIVSDQRDFMSSVFAGGGDKVARAGRINILLLGGDAGKDRIGLRPDSMTVASIDVDSGRTVLFSLPRNMEDVPFPASSPLHKVFPRGYGCADHSCMLNAIYTYAEGHKSLYPGVKNPGAQATKEAAEGVTGLKINYYALVDLQGFQELIDAVGGITITVNKRLPIAGQVPGQKVKKYIEPGTQHMDGYHALWYARSRHADSDYARMARQKCVMSAMLNQLDPVTVLTNFNKIAAAGKQIMQTDVPPSQINKLIVLAGKAKHKQIISVSFVPPFIYPGSPNFPLIRRTVQASVARATDDGLAAAQAARRAAGTASPNPSAPTGTATPAAGSQSTQAPKAQPAGMPSTPAAGHTTAATKKPPAETGKDLSAICSAGPA